MTTLACQGLGWSVDDRWILQGVDLSIANGSMTGIIGRNGSGKTTLLHLLAGIRTPSSGKVLLDGQDLRVTPRKLAAQKLALLEQIPSAHVELTVRQVVQLGRIPHEGRWRRDKTSHIVDEAMTTTQISKLAERSWSTLSGGERQRVQLARALAQQPHVLLLDEPTNHLDLHHQIQLLDLIRGLGITTIAVLHDLDLTAAFVDQVAVLDDGLLVSYDRPENILVNTFVREHFKVDGESRKADRLRFTWRGVA